MYLPTSVSPFCQSSLKQAKTGEHDGQHVVEIMRDAPRQLADRLHLLGLPQGIFRREALLDGFSHPRLQSFIELAQFGIRLLRCVTRLQQLPLVSPAVRCVEDGNADEPQLPGIVPPFDGIDEDRQHRTVHTDNIEGDLVEEALHPQ